MTATVTHTPVTSYDLEGWEILFARHLLDGAVLVTPSERITWAYEAGLTGVAQAMERLSDVADVTRDMIREAARR